MAGISSYAIGQGLTELAQLSSITLPGGFYLALCSATPTAGLTGATIAELTNASGYARQAIAFGAPSAGSSSNTAVVNFPTSSGAWSATATAYAICDSATIGAGNLWFFATLGSSVTVSAANKIVSFAAGSIAMGLS